MSTPLAPLFRLAAGLNRRLPILIYHQVLAETDPLRPDVPDAKAFAAQLDLLASVYRIIPLEEGVERLRAGTLPARALAISFDDGYRDNLEVATPVLKAKGLHASFFLTTAWLQGGLMFNDRIIEAIRRWPGSRFDGRAWGLPELSLAGDAERVRAYETVITAWKHLPFAERAARVEELASQVAGMPGDFMLDAAGVRALRLSGMAIGGHTHDHPILAKLERDAAHETMARNKAELEAILGEKLKLFAYPNGKPGRDYTEEHVRIAKELGYEAAVSTAVGAAGTGADVFQLPRFLPWDKTPSRFLARCLKLAATGEYTRV
ncbi:MAG: polysaccharide deacetylase family protein [Gammaproteobacteria bacterium]|nr:polysaccharide deacetylase family protein [Gammaproteobacteria bacterium]